MILWPTWCGCQSWYTTQFSFLLYISNCRVLPYMSKKVHIDCWYPLEASCVDAYNEHNFRFRGRSRRILFDLIMWFTLYPLCIIILAACCEGFFHSGNWTHDKIFTGFEQSQASICHKMSIVPWHSQNPKHSLHFVTPCLLQRRT